MNTKIISSALLALALFTPLGVWAAGENNTEESCLATFSVSEQTLTIPCVEVVMGNETALYSAQLQQVGEGSFALTQATEVPATVESECVANYSLETGELEVPCVEEVNLPGLPEITGVQLYADNPIEPTLFTTNVSIVNTYGSVRSSSRPMQTATGMYYPADTNSTGGYRGWLSVAKLGTWRGCHLGIDYKKSAGSPVYAVWDGEVVNGGMTVGGYGSNGGVGGAIIVKHLTSDNQPFYAVYGHITNLKIAVGQRVTTGQYIADVANLYDKGQGYIPHLHFGVNVKYPSFKGYTANCQNTFGFVNPQKFIETTTALQSALLKLDSTITVTPNPIIQGQSVTITAKISNREGTKDFLGTLYAAFHRLGDDMVSLFDISLKNQPLGKGQDYTYTFGTAALNLAPGTYHLYIKGDDSRVLPPVTASGLQNPIQVKVVKATTTGGPLPTVTEISPLEATVNQPTNFTVKGSNLTTGMGFTIEHCEGTSAETADSKTRNSTTERTFVCTPRLLGKWLVTVKNQPGGQVLTVPASFQTIVVTGAEIVSISPLQAVLNQPTVFTVTGKNLTAGMGFAIQDCEGSSQETPESIASNSGTQRQFTCVPRGQEGSKTVTVKNFPDKTRPGLLIPDGYGVVQFITSPVLTVPYLKQQSIPDIGGSACASASTAMVLAYHGKIPADTQSMIEAAKTVFAATSNTVVGLLNRDLLRNHLGQEWDLSVVEFSLANNSQGEIYEKIKTEIGNGRPLILGSKSIYSWGHYVVVVGYNGQDYLSGKVIVNDPYNPNKSEYDFVDLVAPHDKLPKDGILVVTPKDQGL